jgi:AraC-like DNA-binding protein
MAAATASGAIPSLAPKPPPTKGDRTLTFSGLDAERVGEFVAVVLQHLVAAAQEQRIALPLCDRSVHLQRRAVVRRRAIGDVAERVGYESEASFGRAFKRSTGIARTQEKG